MKAPCKVRRFFISEERVKKAKKSKGVILPSFVRDVKNIPDEYTYCIYCGEDIRNDGSKTWYVNGFHCSKCKGKSMRRLLPYLFGI